MIIPPEGATISDNFGELFPKRQTLICVALMRMPIPCYLEWRLKWRRVAAVVMSMVIAWHTLNKIANPQNRLYSDAFLIVAPGITVRDRLRVLLPNDSENYYRKMDLIPPDLMPELAKAKIVITNYHTFKLREHTAARKLTKSILNQGKDSAFTETHGQMVRRVCQGLGNKKNIIVINDEADRCYRRRVGGDEVKLKGDESRLTHQNRKCAHSRAN